jgi:hypothetical protein
MTRGNVRLLQALFAAVLLAMIAVTVLASMERNIVDAALALWPDPWFRATLADAYFGFLTVFVWVAYRERSHLARLIWLLLFLGLGNLAIAAYVLIRLARLRPGDGMAALLLREQDLPGR